MNQDTADLPETPLSRSEKYLRALFESLTTAVLVADDDGRYVDANTSVCRLLKRDRDEVIGLTVPDIVADVRPSLDARWKSFLRDGEQTGFVDLKMPDGTIRTAHFHAFANFVPGLHCSFLSPMRGEQLGEQDDLNALVVCAWTRRVKYQGEWMPFEKYLLMAHGEAVTHGISPDAFKYFRGESGPDAE